MMLYVYHEHQAPGALVSAISNSTNTFFRTSRPPPPPPGGTGLLGIYKTVEHRAWGLAGNVDMGAGVVVHYELMIGIMNLLTTCPH